MNFEHKKSGKSSDNGEKVTSERQELVKRCQFHWEEWIKAVSELYELNNKLAQQNSNQFPHIIPHPVYATGFMWEQQPKSWGQ